MIAAEPAALLNRPFATPEEVPLRRFAVLSMLARLVASRFGRGSQWVTIAFEIVLGLGILAGSSFILPLSWGFIEIQPHPFWIVILMQATRYGSGPGIVAALIGGAIELVLVFTAPVGTYLDYSLLLAQPFLFLLVATMVGEVRETYRRRETDLAENNRQMSASLRDLAQRYLAASEVTEELQRRIVGQTATVLTLHEAARRLDTLDSGEVYPALLDLLAGFLHIEEASIYLFRDERLVPIAHLPNSSPALRPPPDPAAIEAAGGIAARALASGRMETIRDERSQLSARQFAEAPLLMAAPILGRSGETLGVVTVERMPFLQFTSSAARLFGIIVEWASQALQNALLFQESQDKSIEDELTSAYSFPYMQRRMHQEMVRTRRYGDDLAVLAFRIESFDAVPTQTRAKVLQVIGMILTHSLRDCDIVGLDERPGHFLTLLPSTPEQGARIVAERICHEVRAFRFKPFEDDRTLELSYAVALAAGDDRDERSVIARAAPFVRAAAEAPAPPVAIRPMLEAA